VSAGRSDAVPDIERTVHPRNQLDERGRVRPIVEPLDDELVAENSRVKFFRHDFERDNSEPDVMVTTDGLVAVRLTMTVLVPAATAVRHDGLERVELLASLALAEHGLNPIRRGVAVYVRGNDGRTRGGYTAIDVQKKDRFIEAIVACRADDTRPAHNTRSADDT